MIKRDWPKIYERKINGAIYWIVDPRRYHAGERTGKLEYFKTEKQAEGRASIIRSETIEHGHSKATSLDVETRVDAIRAEEILKPYGIGLIEAARIAVKNIEDQKKPRIILKKAIEEWLKWKKTQKDAGDIEPISYSTAEFRVEKLLVKFSDVQLNDLNQEKYENWLIETGFEPQTKSGLKSIHSEFFKWCQHDDRKWIDKNPCQFVVIKRKDKEVEILSPVQCEGLLKQAREHAFMAETAPYFYIGLFAGLRPSELKCLEWKDILFETREIKVKSESIRYVPISENLCRAIIHYRKSGYIVGKNWRKKFDSVKTSCGFGEDNPYPQDSLRHSFASYWLAMSINGIPGYDGGKNRLSEIMGNSVDIIKRHYQRAIPLAEAEAFWGILEPGKQLSLVA